jgi:hypothetical protein
MTQETPTTDPSAALNAWITEHWDEIPEIEF